MRTSRPRFWIENTNVCNAKCVMCPRDQQTRAQGYMEFSLYEKLIREVAEHRDQVKRVHMHNYGEPLLDKELPRRIRLAKELGIKHVYFVTNASLLSPEKSRELIESGLDEFKISFYGTDKATYNATMKGLDFDRTIQNVKDFLRIRKELGSTKPRVVIQYLPQATNKGQVDAFQQTFSPLIDRTVGDTLNIFSLHNFGGARSSMRNEGVCSICTYPWRTMVILHNGNVALCCLDFNGVQIMGNAKEMSIKELWNSDRYRKTREDFKLLRYQEYPVCITCDGIR